MNTRHRRPVHSRPATLGLLVALLLAPLATAQTPAASRTLVRAGRLIDGASDKIRSDQGILIEKERILRVGPYAEVAAAAKDAQVIDLSALTVLPGLIDNHTHILLQGDITAQDYDEQLLKESIPYRTIRATVAARTALLNGFTALRDLETEGAMYADVDVKKAIERGVIPCPRMFVSTLEFALSSMYLVEGYNSD